MLKKKYRLAFRIRPRFTSSFVTQFFLLRVAHNGLSYNRYGFVASRNIDKRATARNRAKRVFRACIENIFGDLKTGYDMLFILKRNVLSASKNELCSFIKTTLAKEGFLK